MTLWMWKIHNVHWFGHIPFLKWIQLDKLLAPQTHWPNENIYSTLIRHYSCIPFLFVRLFVDGYVRRRHFIRLLFTSSGGEKPKFIKWKNVFIFRHNEWGWSMFRSRRIHHSNSISHCSLVYILLFISRADSIEWRATNDNDGNEKVAAVVVVISFSWRQHSIRSSFYSPIYRRDANIFQRNTCVCQMPTHEKLKILYYIEIK